MENSIKLTLLFSALLATVSSAPYPSPQEGPFAAIGNFIQRLQSSFNEGSEAIRQSNNVIPPLILPATNGTTTTTTTTSTTTTAPPTTSFFKPATNPFDSINAILDNIGRSSSNSLGSGNNNNNNIFGSVPGRNPIEILPFTTPRPLPPLTTSRSPFDMEGINQGINAFFQAFIKTNLDKLFKQGQDQNQQHSITTRSDAFQQQRQRQPSFGEVIINSLFKKPQ